MKLNYPENLPINSHRQELIAAIQQFPVVIIEGETGSGKSTQIPKMIFEALGKKVKIACTQPRRIAAVAIAARIAEECEVESGTSIGHKIRFNDLTSPHTQIMICTDGILLQETKFDELLLNYDAIFIDEAHERSLRIEFLLGVVKDIQQKRLLQNEKPLKIIVASATLDTKKFAHFFSQKNQPAPAFNISGRMFPVTISYTPFIAKEHLSYEIAKLIEKIHLSQRKGDILVFLPGQQEIVMAIQMIDQLNIPDLKCLPLFSRLSIEEQVSIFAPHPGKRHVVVSTNIAETSLTVPGVTVVIDSGLAKMTDFNTRTGIGSLTVQKISQSSAIQRTGRAGRIEPGICYRLFGEEDFKNRELYTKPEIQRSDLAEVVLQMTLMKIPNIHQFEFVDPPNPQAFQQAFETLRTVGALDRHNQLTEVGRKMAYLPLDPRISRMLLAAERYECVKEIAVIASFLSVKDPFQRPREFEEEADRSRSYFQNLGMLRDSQKHSKHKNKNRQNYFSDLLTYLALWKKVFLITDETLRQQYCASNYLNFQALEEAKLIYQQLIETLTQFGSQEFSRYLEKKDSMLEAENLAKPLNASQNEGILKSIASGQIQNLCQRNYSGQYRSQKIDRVIIHPGSLFSMRRPEWIVATEIIETSQLFARNVTEINPAWLSEIAPNFRWEKPRYQKRQTRKSFSGRKGRKPRFRKRK